MWIASVSSCGVRQPEVSRNGALEGGLGAAAVLAAGRRRDRGHADVVASAPVAAELAERREPHLAPVRPDADAVDPGAADDRDAPAALGAGPQDGERVVGDRGRLGPAQSCDPLLEHLFLGGEVDPGHAEARDGGDRRAVGAGDSRLLDGLPEEALEHLDAAVDAEVVRRAQRPAHEREDAAVGRDEREVGLRVAAVDGEDDRRAHASACRSERLGLEQPLDEVLVQRVLADQRVGEQRLPRHRGVGGDRRLRGEPLVGGDVLGEPKELRRERRLGKGREAPVLHPRRNLDDVIVRQPGERAVISDVDLVHDAVVADERGDEPGRGLAVERAAALLEQRRLLVQRRVAVELEQAALDLGDDLGPRDAAELLAEDRVVAVEVLEVRRGDDAELLEQVQRQSGLVRDRLAVRGHQLGEDVATVDVDGADPREVVEADLVDDDLAPARARGASRTSAGSRSPRCRGRRRGGPRRAASG